MAKLDKKATLKFDAELRQDLHERQLLVVEFITKFREVNKKRQAAGTALPFNSKDFWDAFGEEEVAWDRYAMASKDERFASARLQRFRLDGTDISGQ